MRVVILDICLQLFSQGLLSIGKELENMLFYVNFWQERFFATSQLMAYKEFVYHNTDRPDQVFVTVFLTQNIITNKIGIQGCERAWHNLQKYWIGCKLGRQYWHHTASQTEQSKGIGKFSSTKTQSDKLPGNFMDRKKRAEMMVAHW